MDLFENLTKVMNSIFRKCTTHTPTSFPPSFQHSKVLGTQEVFSDLDIIKEKALEQDISENASST